MLRISRDKTSSSGSVSLRFEGEMTGPWVDETSRVCDAIMAGSQRLRMDLSRVAFVDRRGLELLARLKKRKMLLSHCSPLLKAQLRSLRGRSSAPAAGD